MTIDAELEEFLRLSSALTGFEEIDLEGTGVAPLYLSTLNAQAGRAATAALLAAFAALPGGDEDAVRERIMAQPALGPLARNLIKLWYLGIWEQLDVPGGQNDPGFVVSDEAYAQALVWVAMGAHAKGARQPGFGSWRFAPGTPRS